MKGILFNIVSRCDHEKGTCRKSPHAIGHTQDAASFNSSFLPKGVSLERHSTLDAGELLIEDVKEEEDLQRRLVEQDAQKMSAFQVETQYQSQCSGMA